MLSRVTVSLSPLLRSKCHWSPLPWAGGRKRGRSIRLPTWGTVMSGGGGSAYGLSQNPGFLLSLFKGFKKSFSFCCCRSCSAPQVLFCGLAVKVQLLFRELLAALNQSSLDRGPGGATWLWKLQRPKWALGMSAEEIHSANPPSLVPTVTCSLSVSRLARSKFQGHSECKESLPTKQNGLLWWCSGHLKAWLLTLPLAASSAAVSSGWASCQLSTGLYPVVRVEEWITVCAGESATKDQWSDCFHSFLHWSPAHLLCAGTVLGAADETVTKITEISQCGCWRPVR